MLACVARLEQIDHRRSLEATIEVRLHIRRKLRDDDGDETTVVGEVGPMVGEQRW